MSSSNNKSDILNFAGYVYGSTIRNGL